MQRMFRVFEDYLYPMHRERCAANLIPACAVLWCATWLVWYQTYGRWHRSPPKLVTYVNLRFCVISHGMVGVTGRVNHTDKWLLPNGEWPIWCSWCRGSGLMYCDDCLGTGKHRDKMGFQLPHNGN